MEGSGGESTGRPGILLSEFVVTEVVSVAVVGTWSDVANCWRSSKLLTEDGGLVALVPSSDRLGRRAVVRDTESRLSVEGFPRGGGMLMLALVGMAVVVSIWALLRMSAPLLTARRV